MPIRAGDLIASTSGTSANLISDGQRLRVKWSPGSGDGNPSLHIIERSIGTKRGHPTWKVYCGDPRVDKDLVPKYVYLDDKAAHEIWRGEMWSKQDMKKFWPFDFDAMGRIMGRRKNRGRPAVGEGGEYETGVLRDKSKVFVFKGGPEYVPAPPVENEDAGGKGIVAEAATGDAALVSLKAINPVRTPDMAQDVAVASASIYPSPPLYPPNPYELPLAPMDGFNTIPKVFRFDIPTTTTKSSTNSGSGDLPEIGRAKRKAGDTEEAAVAKKMKSGNNH